MPTLENYDNMLMYNISSYHTCILSIGRVMLPQELFRAGQVPLALDWPLFTIFNNFPYTSDSFHFAHKLHYFFDIPYGQIDITFHFIFQCSFIQQ